MPKETNSIIGKLVNLKNVIPGYDGDVIPFTNMYETYPNSQEARNQRENRELYKIEDRTH